jgi:hypothetical protein
METGSARHQAEFTVSACELTRVESDFASQIAAAVWLRRLTDEAAREALGSYAMACHRSEQARAGLWAALEDEYRRCRERQDICS